MRVMPKWRFPRKTSGLRAFQNAFSFDISLFLTMPKETGSRGAVRFIVAEFPSRPGTFPRALYVSTVLVVPTAGGWHHSAAMELAPSEQEEMSIAFAFWKRKDSESTEACLVDPEPGFPSSQSSACHYPQVSRWLCLLSVLQLSAGCPSSKISGHECCSGPFSLPWVQAYQNEAFSCWGRHMRGYASLASVFPSLTASASSIVDPLSSAAVGRGALP